MFYLVRFADRSDKDAVYFMPGVVFEYFVFLFFVCAVPHWILHTCCYCSSHCISRIILNVSSAATFSPLTAQYRVQYSV